MLFCEKCGNQIEEGSLFCGICGAPVNAAGNEPQTAPVTEVVAPEAENIPMDTFFSEEESNNKKKGRMPIWAKIGIPVVALGLVAVIVLNIATIWGTLLRWVGSGESYFRFVQSKEIDAMSENFIENYYSSRTENKEFKTTLSMGVTVDESLGELLLIEDDEILKLINDVELVTTLNSQKEKLGADVALNLSDKQIISLETILDAGNDSVYFTVPEILDTYMKSKLGLDEADISFDIFNETAEALPEDDDLKELIKNYSTLIFDCVEDVEKESHTLKIDGIEQDCTSLSFEITDELATKMAKAVLEEAKDDETVKKVIEDIEEAIGTDEDAYDEFVDAVDEALDELDDYEAEDITFAEITEYVNHSHEIIGFEIEVEDQTVFFATAVDGNEVATEINFMDQLLLVGKGSVEDDLLAGKFTLEMSDKKLAEIKLSNYDIELAEKGLFAGNIKLSLLDDGIDMLDSEAASVFKLLNPSIEIDVKRPDDNKCDLKLNLLGSSNTVLLGFDATVTTSDNADNISVPKDAIDIEDEEAMAELAASLDFEKILENLKDAGVPDELFEMLTQLVAPTPDPYGYDAYGDFATSDDIYDFSETNGYDTW